MRKISGSSNRCEAAVRPRWYAINLRARQTVAYLAPLYRMVRQLICRGEGVGFVRCGLSARQLACRSEAEFTICRVWLCLNRPIRNNRRTSRLTVTLQLLDSERTNQRGFDQSGGTPRAGIHLSSGDRMTQQSKTNVPVGLHNSATAKDKIRRLVTFAENIWAQRC